MGILRKIDSESQNVYNKPFAKHYLLIRSIKMYIKKLTSLQQEQTPSEFYCPNAQYGTF